METKSEESGGGKFMRKECKIHDKDYLGESC